MVTLGRKIRQLTYRNYGKRDQFKIYYRIGLKLLLNYSNHIDRYLIIKEPYESEQLDHFINILTTENFDLFVDVGANIGLYSLLAANTGEIENIIAFEPDIRNNYQFKTNILLNNFFKKIKVYDYGLSNENTEVNFLSEKGRSTGHSRIEITAPTSTKTDRFEKTIIKVAKFDSKFDFNSCKVFIKMDVEGHELNAIKGMKEFLKKNKCIFQVEVFEENMANVKSYMDRLGYHKIREFGEDRIFINY